MTSQVRPKSLTINALRTAALVLLLLSGAGVFSFSMLGCARQEGTAVQPMDLARIREGVSTMGDVKRILGKPDEVKTLLGDQIWIYLHTERKGWMFSKTQVRQVSIHFNSQGIVRKVDVQKHVHEGMF
jgi:outer membrane protein assembly factor BamE (lipoprotein component of BamABCDE complex)